MQESNYKRKLIVGISGASGAILGINIVHKLKQHPQWETHLIISENSKDTISLETKYFLKDVIELSDYYYSIDDMGARISSGTFKAEGMVIAPCSMKTLAGINSGYSDNLILRAADVALKERRKLLLVTRETPLSQIHLRNMLELSNSGAVIMPPVMTFYNKPDTIDDMINHITDKVLDYFGIEMEGFKRWD